MARLVLVPTGRESGKNADLSHRASGSDGEAAIRLLESKGYPAKSRTGNESSHACPFHEEMGPVPYGKSPNFFVNRNSGLWYCHSASCGERGNLHMLERHFGINVDDSYLNAVRTREDELVMFEMSLSKGLRKPFYEHGLTDAIIERFRLGWDQQHQRYVIPYLEGRRPVLFRYYQPYGDPKYKYTWEKDAESRLFNAGDAVGDGDGMVLVCEGELKAMLAVQLGYAAVAVPGAGQWKDEWQAKFTHARKIVVVFDNDNPAFHVYDKPEVGQRCHRCSGRGVDRCCGHNPGQDAAMVRVKQLGWRAKNIVLPLPDEALRKTDLNDFFMRDGGAKADLQEMITGRKDSRFKVQTLAEITASPPEETKFLIDQGILPSGGRLLVSGAPKVGKSLYVQNMALSLASGIPFLGRFGVTRPTRVLLLDRELSKWSLFKRLGQLIESRPGYKAALGNLLIDHDHLLRLDQPGGKELLLQLIMENGAEVVFFDTAYKFMGDVEKSTPLKKSFEVLDSVIHETGCSVVVTHHQRKSGAQGRESTDVDPENVAGSYLWTGWPNGTILLNFKDRSVVNPYNVIATCTAFRDAAAPDPLVLYRGSDSIAYKAIEDYTHGSGDHKPSAPYVKPTTAGVQEVMLDACPSTEEDILNVAAARFGVSVTTIRPYYLDALAQGYFSRQQAGGTSIVIFDGDQEENTWESDHNMDPNGKKYPEGVIDFSEARSRVQE